jgi:hypothetical protein
VFELQLQGPVRVAARALIEGRSLDETATLVRERCGLAAPPAELVRLPETCSSTYRARRRWSA